MTVFRRGGGILLSYGFVAPLASMNGYAPTFAELEGHVRQLRSR